MQNPGGRPGGCWCLELTDALFDITVCCSDCSSALMSWRRCSSASLSINTAAVCDEFSIWPILSRRFLDVLSRFWYPFSSQKRLVSSITHCLRPFTFLGQSSELWSCLAISLQCKRSTHIFGVQWSLRLSP